MVKHETLNLDLRARAAPDLWRNEQSANMMRYAVASFTGVFLVEVSPRLTNHSKNFPRRAWASLDENKYIKGD